MHEHVNEYMYSWIITGATQRSIETRAALLVCGTGLLPATLAVCDAVLLCIIDQLLQLPCHAPHGGNVHMPATQLAWCHFCFPAA